MFLLLNHIYTTLPNHTWKRSSCNNHKDYAADELGVEKGKGPRYVFLILVENKEKNIIGKKNGVNCCIHCLACKKEHGRQNSKEMCVDGPPIFGSHHR
uniref:Uncharacterized protein n=1 Tax=Glycine max TaxID=3847 RepID=A0A0R0H4T0_SOYBN